MVATKLCRDCYEELELNTNNFYINKYCKDGFTPNCRVCYRKSRQDYYHLRGGKEKIQKRSKIVRDAVKIEVLNYYGKQCACCGESEYAFLAIDHINGGGTKHRKELGLGGSAFYEWLKKNKFPNGFQVLCHNCNFGKHTNGGICPHKLK